jgi:hypothetical protein
MSMTKTAILLASLVLAAACSSRPGPTAGTRSPAPDTTGAAPTAPLDDTLKVELGKSTAVDGGRFVATFTGRLADSRCPANVTCVWMGDAAVRILARAAGRSVEQVLHTGIEPHSLGVGRYTVTVVGLLPYPGTGVEGEPMVLLRVTAR